MAPFYAKYPERAAQNSSKRRAAKRQAVPRWANHAMIAEWYKLAEEMTKLCGLRFHVDHIVPLVSDIVCGLHWEGNLQILPFDENIHKGNRYWPDMPT